MPFRSRSRRRTEAPHAAIAVALLLACAAAASAGEAGFPPWQKFADVDVIDVVTRDADGDVRETPVWFVLVDGAPYLRTNGSRWLANILRGSEVGVRIEGLDYEVSAVRVEGDDIIARVDAASLEKYGWQERLLFLRLAPPDILKLVPRR